VSICNPYIPPVPGGIYGTGEEYNYTNGQPVPWNFYGQSGWWRVPSNWFVRNDASGSIFASPNQDFSNPVYYCKTNLDGVLVFQSEMLNLLAGNTNPFLPNASAAS